MTGRGEGLGFPALPRVPIHAEQVAESVAQDVPVLPCQCRRQTSIPRLFQHLDLSQIAVRVHTGQHLIQRRTHAGVIIA